MNHRRMTMIVISLLVFLVVGLVGTIIVVIGHSITIDELSVGARTRPIDWTLDFKWIGGIAATLTIIVACIYWLTTKEDQL